MKKVILFMLFMALTIEVSAKIPQYVFTSWDQRIPDQEWFKAEFAGHDYVSYDLGAAYLAQSIVVVNKNDSYEIIILDGFFNKIYRREVNEEPIFEWAFRDLVSEVNSAERTLNNKYIYGTISNISYVNSDGETLATMDICRYHFGSKEADDNLMDLLNFFGGILKEEYPKDHPELYE